MCWCNPQDDYIRTCEAKQDGSVHLVPGICRGDLPGGKHAWQVSGHCFYHTRGGQRYPDPEWYPEWPGRTGAEPHDRIGLLLDTTEGSLTVFVNDCKLGVMQSSGLTGSYRWATSMYRAGDSVRIEPGPSPAALVATPGQR